MPAVWQESVQIEIHIISIVEEKNPFMFIGSQPDPCCLHRMFLQLFDLGNGLITGGNCFWRGSINLELVGKSAFGETSPRFNRKTTDLVAFIEIYLRAV